MKKLRNQTSGGARDDGDKFIWYDEVDEILSLTAKANGVLGRMDQGVLMPGTGSFMRLSMLVRSMMEMVNQHGCSHLLILVHHHLLVPLKTAVKVAHVLGWQT